MENFETTRLRVEGWRPSVARRSSRELLIDELTSVLTCTVMRHLPAVLHVEQTRDAIAQWIADRNAETEVLTLRDRTLSTLLGLLILAEIPDNDGRRSLHLGYLFGQAAWGRGYATELVSGLVEQVKSQGTAARIVGGVENANKASARVLEKAGFEKLTLLSNKRQTFFVKTFPQRR